MRLVDGMARPGDFYRVAVRPRIVPLLKIGIDDLVRQRNDSPTRLCFPRGCGQRRAEDLGCRKNLGSRLEVSLRTRQIGGEKFMKDRGVEESEAVGGLFDGPL